MIAKKLLTTIAFAFVLLFSGCAEDDFNQIDGLCPIVVSTVPEDGDIDVPLNQVITATFNEIMNPATITGASFTVSANGVLIAGTVSYNGLTATFRPTLPLEPDTEYTGTITTLAKDPRGNALQENYVWTFTTLPEYEVRVSSNPTTGPIPTGAGIFLKGTAVTVTALPYAGYTFTNWTENGTLVSTSPNLTFVLMGDRNLVANYTIIPPMQFAVTTVASPPAGGSTTGDNAYDQGTLVTVEAFANTGYNFVNWTNKDTGLPVSPLAKYSFVLNGNTNLQANFVLKTYTIFLSSNPLLGGDTDGEGTFNYGTTQTVTATAKANFTFNNWTENGVIVPGAGASYQFVLTGNRTLVANFTAVIPQFTITLISDTNQGTTLGAGTYPSGSTRTVTATAKPGYTFSNWTENNVIVPLAGANYTFVLLQNRTLTANFTATPPPTGGLCPNPAVNLGLAGNYAILAESAISTTGVTSVTGDMGISPLAATFITGFGLTLHSSGTYSTSTLVNGKIYAADYTSPTPSNLTVTVDNMHTAFTTANGLAPDRTEYLAGNLNNVTLPAGVYKYGTGLLLTNTITLDGGGVDCAAFVFQIAGDLTVANNVKIVLINGAKADNIFWVTAGAGAVIGTDVDFSGNILSKTLISLEARSTVKGRLLAQSAVSLIGNTVVKPSN